MTNNEHRFIKELTKLTRRYGVAIDTADDAQVVPLWWLEAQRAYQGGRRLPAHRYVVSKKYGYFRWGRYRHDYEQ